MEHKKDIDVASGREQGSLRSLLDVLRKIVPAHAGLIVAVMPRGDLQVVQPVNAPEGLLKAYTRGFHAQDALTWKTIVHNKPTTLAEAWKPGEMEETSYFAEFVRPQGMAHVISLPLASPLLAGYPGAVHLGRTAEQGEFTAAEVEQLTAAIADYESRTDKLRQEKREPAPGAKVIERPAIRFAIVDSQLKPVLSHPEWTSLDDQLRQEMANFTQRKAGNLNGHPSAIDRVLLHDSHGDTWTYRVVTYRPYPALGEGAFSFFCLQPDAAEWGLVKSVDLNADAELARLVPSLKFMQEQFASGPTLVDIAKTVELSPFHFHRRFSELLGLTPKQFLLECQINQAKTDLLAREKELAQIAKECGFAHQSHFTSRFKQATGLTPTRWRRIASERYVVSAN